MDAKELQPEIWLGCDHSPPSLFRYNVETETFFKVVTPASSSCVRALARHDSDGGVTIGTCTGSIYQLDRETLCTSRNVFPTALYRGRIPIVSLCWLDSSRLVFSDIGVRCLTRTQTKSSNPQPLLWRKGPVVSLQVLDDWLIGLSLRGAIYYWQATDLKPVLRIPVPPPISLAAGISALHWPTAGALVWPGQTGDLIVYDWKKQKVYTFKRDSEDTLALALWQDRLVTVGRKEGQLMTWQAGNSRPESVAPFFPGVVALALWGHRLRRGLIITEKWGGLVEEEAPGRWIMHKRVFNGEIRLLQTPTFEEWKAFEDRQRAEKARAISREIENTIEQDPKADLTQLYQQLDELDLGHITLILRSQQFRKLDDFPNQLQTYHQLVKLMEDRLVPELIPHWWRYGRMLERIGLWTAARWIYEQIGLICPSDRAYRQLRSVGRAVTLQQAGRCWLHGGLSVAALLDAADRVMEPLWGRLIVRSLPPRACKGVRLDPRWVLYTYRNLVRETGHEFYPLPRLEVVSVYRDDQMVPATMFTLVAGEGGPTAGLGLAFELYDDDLQSIWVPHVLFQIAKPTPGLSAQNHNEAVRGRWRQMAIVSRASFWLESVDRMVCKALGRQINRSKAQEGF